MLELWNERYRQPEYAYGKLPNDYLHAKLPLFAPGKILFPAEGEGRNAVYAATLGWDCHCFDQSTEGRKKALDLAAAQGVTIQYQAAEFQQLDYPEESFDAIALIYAHFPADLKSAYHRRLCTWLKKGGIIIFEAFSKEHLNFNRVNEKVGGPKDAGMLFSLEEIRADFSGFEILELEEMTVELNEGLYHVGTGSVIRFLGRKR